MQRSKDNLPEEFRLYHQYFNEVKKYPVLSKSEECALIEKVKKGSQSAKNKLICSNLRFVIKIAFMYRGQGLPIPDLINEGNLGLIQAADRFVPEKKVKFTSYAVWWIRQSIVQALFEKARLVRLSASNELQIRQLKKAQSANGNPSEYATESEISHLAKQTGNTKSQTQKLLLMNQKSLSLNTPISNRRNLTIADIIKSESIATPEIEVNLNSLKDYLCELLDFLTPKEKKIVRMFFGLDSGKELNLTELGELFGLSKERIRQIKESALEKLRDLKLNRQQLLAA